MRGLVWKGRRWLYENLVGLIQGGSEPGAIYCKRRIIEMTGCSMRYISIPIYQEHELGGGYEGTICGELEKLGLLLGIYFPFHMDLRVAIFWFGCLTAFSL